MRKRRVWIALALVGCTSDADPEEKPVPPDLGAATAEPRPPEPTKQPPPRPEPPRPAGTVTECPKALAGKETFDRVIRKACGTVAVTADYKLDGGTLTLEAGAKLAFAANTGLQVGYYDAAKLVVLGTANEPVVFTSQGGNAPGTWRGIQLYGKATGSTIRNAAIEYAGDKKAALHVEAEHVVVENVRIEHAMAAAVEVRGGGRFDAFTANRIADVAKVAMRVSASAASTIGASNALPADAVVQIERGVIGSTTTWKDIGAPWMISGRIDVRGAPDRPAELRIEAGTRLVFDGDGHLRVGDGGPGNLAIDGMPGKLVELSAFRRSERGAWRGVLVHAQGQARIAHAVFRHGGKKDDEGALAIDGGRIDLSDTTFASNKVAVVLRGDTLDVQRFEAVTFEDTATAIDLPASKLGAIGDRNVYEGEPVVAIAGGTIAADTTWRRQPGAKMQLMGRLQVAGGTLTVQQGVTIHVKDGVAIEIGHAAEGTLVMRGTADAPIALLGMRDVSGAWKGLVFFDKAKGNALAHVRLRNAGGSAAAIEVKGAADVAIEALACEKCSMPALTWACASNVTAKGVEAKEDTPAAEKPPEGCAP